MRYTYLFLSAVWVCVYSCGGGGSSLRSGSEKKVAAVLANHVHTYQVVNRLENGEEVSYTTWTGSKVGGKHQGRFSVTEGYLQLQENALIGGRVVIDIASLEIVDIPADDADNAKLRGHLLSEDFFDAEKHQTGIFELTNVAPYDETIYQDKAEYESENKPESASAHRVSNPTHNISGNLTLRGTTRNITFPARIEVDDESLAATASFNIDRSEWGIAYGDENSVVDKAVDRFIYNTVNVGLALAAYHRDEDAPKDDDDPIE